MRGLRPFFSKRARVIFVCCINLRLKFGRTTKAVLTERHPVPTVVTPTPDRDRALNGIVGVVALVGFVVGIAWPRFLGVKVGPDVPGGTTPSPAASDKPNATTTPGTASATVSATEPSPKGEGPDEEAGVTNKQQVVIGAGEVSACRNKKGEKQDECGKIAFDAHAKKHLEELARCPSAIGLEGTLSLQVSLNFEKNVVSVDGFKKKADIPSSTQKGVLNCAGEAFKGLELEGIPHTHLRYSLIYPVSFYPPGKEPPKPAAPGEEAPAEESGLGSASVKWEKALGRETPEEGKVVARLAQGTRMKLLEQKGDWYRIESSKAKGWVYRQAIGK